jgi:hypothetical protein
VRADAVRQGLGVVTGLFDAFEAAKRLPFVHLAPA